jgi:hypothetical protein
MCFVPQTSCLFSVYFLKYVYVFNSIRPKMYFHKHFDIFMGLCGMHRYVHMFEEPVFLISTNISFARIAYIFRVELLVHYKSNTQFMQSSFKSFIFPFFLSLFLPGFNIRTSYLLHPCGVPNLGLS